MFKALASSSKGNCYLYGRLMVDCGLPKRDIPYEDVDALIITHGHGDHVKLPALRGFLKLGIPVYVPTEYKRKRTKTPFAKLTTEEKDQIIWTSIGATYEVDGLFDKIKFKLLAEVPHDVPNHCYHLEVGDWKAFHATDCGSLEHVELECEYDHYTIEFNYCQVLVYKMIRDNESGYTRFRRTIKDHHSVQQGMKFYRDRPGGKGTLYKAHKSEAAYTMANYLKAEARKRERLCKNS